MISISRKAACRQTSKLSRFPPIAHLSRVRVPLRRKLRPVSRRERLAPLSSKDELSSLFFSISHTDSINDCNKSFARDVAMQRLYMVYLSHSFLKLVSAQAKRLATALQDFFIQSSTERSRRSHSALFWIMGQIVPSCCWLPVFCQPESNPFISDRKVNN